MVGQAESSSRSPATVKDPAACPAIANGSFNFHSFSCSSRPLLLQFAW